MGAPSRPLLPLSAVLPRHLVSVTCLPVSNYNNAPHPKTCPLSLPLIPPGSQPNPLPWAQVGGHGQDWEKPGTSFQRLIVREILVNCYGPGLSVSVPGQCEGEELVCHSRPLLCYPRFGAPINTASCHLLHGSQEWPTGLYCQVSQRGCSLLRQGNPVLQKLLSCARVSSQELLFCPLILPTASPL